jgi:pectin methylesterase-like acyl-CoA thioesterase
MKRTILLVGIMATAAMLGNLSASAGRFTAQSVLQNDVAQAAPQSPIASGAQNVLIVSPSGGNFTSIQAALNSITNNSSRNTFLIWVGPGTYNEQVTMKPYVDIEGAGEKVTKITFGISSLTTGTVVGADNAELRFLTVENTGVNGVNTYAFAIYNGGASPSLLHVTAMASGGTYSNVGVFNNSSSSPSMTNVIATASGSGSTFNSGVYNYSSSPNMTNVTATSSGGRNSTGVWSDRSSAKMNNVTATGSGGYNSNAGVGNAYSSPSMTNVTATASGGTFTYGVQNNDHSYPSMTNVTATASGGATNYGVFNDYSSPSINGVTISASTGTSYAVYNNASSPTISNSKITGDTDAIFSTGSGTIVVQNSQLTGTTFAAYSDTGVILTVGGSYLSGGRVTGPGTSACAGNYDENYIFYASTCP